MSQMEIPPPHPPSIPLKYSISEMKCVKLYTIQLDLVSLCLCRKECIMNGFIRKRIYIDLHHMAH